MNVVLCEYAEKRKFTAGNKARTDTLKILMGIGYEHIPLYRSKSNKIFIIFQMVAGCVKTVCKTGKNDVVFIQYPYYPAIINQFLLSVLSMFRRHKDFKIAVLIHDLVGLRMEGDKTYNISKEVKWLNKADYVICHNKRMLNEIKKCGIKEDTEYEILGPFDYLYEGVPVKVEYKKKPTIIIAGNLSKEKCGYVYKIHILESCLFNLYGVDYSGIEYDNVQYKGQYSPEELIENLEGNYGLVWDGEEVDTCAGAYGEYLKYNNPHKFSLYLAAGLPLIVWSQSALAEYVEDYCIGICIDSLKMLSSKLETVKKEQYDLMVDNVLAIRSDIISGKHLTDTVKGLMYR